MASTALKRWPLEHFAAVADHVIEREDVPVLLIEGPQAGAGRAVQDAMRHGERAIRVGAEHLLRTAALLRRCRGLVCNDTGLMHLAGAVAVPTVAVFGPTRASIFLPPGRDIMAVEPRALQCGYRDHHSLSPPECWHAGRCLIADRGCIHRIGVEDVRWRVERLPHRRGALTGTA